ncbi:MAG: NADH-quinone oxidoreductase subunit C [Bacteroidales bacterium]|jgi:NADH:ubiquinone oxidoreductase subunit C
MNKTELTAYVRSLAPGCEVKEGKQFSEIDIPAELLHGVALKLRQDEAASFDFLDCITGIDYGQYLGAIYHLFSTRHGHTIVLRVRTGDRENPHFDSITDIWKSADFLEREVFDLLGIKFTNHPDLRRLFLDKSWGFPLRKDYADDIKIVTK